MTGHIRNRQMVSFMLFQSVTPAECLVTFPTGKWLLYCVDPFMIFKSQLPVNDFSHLEQANGVFMLFQSTTPAERLVTFPTGMFWCLNFYFGRCRHLCCWGCVSAPKVKVALNEKIWNILSYLFTVGRDGANRKNRRAKAIVTCMLDLDQSKKSIQLYCCLLS